MTGRKIVRKVSVAAMTNPQRCGTIDNPHTFVKDLRRCQLCNKHIRDIHISDYISADLLCRKRNLYSGTP